MTMCELVSLKVSAGLAEPVKYAIHPYKLGDFVFVELLDKVSLSPRWTGPYKVLLTMRTALKVEGHEMLKGFLWTALLFLLASGRGAHILKNYQSARAHICTTPTYILIFHT